MLGNLRWADLRRLETLHESPSSSVFIARRESGLSSTELLVVKRAKITEAAAIGRFRAEAALLRECSRAAATSSGAASEPPSIVALLCVIEEAPRYALVLPHYQRGTLYDLLHRPGASALEPAAWLSLSRDVFRALLVVHSCGVVHRDVKPQNVLLAADGSAVLADFGVAARAAELEAQQRGERPVPPAPSGGFHRLLIVGTLPYMAPELLRAAPASYASDVYAAAIVANETATGEVPYAGARTSAAQMHTLIEFRFSCDSLAAAVASDGLRPELADESRAPPSFAVGVLTCWSPSPSLRPTAAAALAALDTAAAELGLPPGKGGAAGHASVRHALELRMLADASALQPSAAAVAVAPQPTAARPPLATASASAAALSNGGGSGKQLLRLDGSWEASPGLRGPDRMEDRAELRLFKDGARASLALCIDGHGGARCAQFCADALSAQLNGLPHAAAPEAGQARPQGAAAQGALDCEALRAQLGRAFAQAHESWLRSPDCDESGAAVLACLVSQSSAHGAHLHVASVGDCTAVLCRDGRALVCTREHVASEAQERAAVEARGGHVVVAPDGKARVAGRIQLTRALGDRELQQPCFGLSCVPELSSLQLSRADELLVLGSDGLFEKMSPAEVIRLARATVCSAELIARRLVTEALARGSSDNVTAIVLTFSWPPAQP